MDGGSLLRRSCFLAVALASLASSLRAGPVVHCSQTGARINCRIDQPTVTQERTDYQAIVFQPGDRLFVQAGGCAQSGGVGSTWHRYVNPSGGNTDRLYHGTISIPGVTGPSLVRIQGWVNKWIQLPATLPPGDRFLVLGFEDDHYGDNGYNDHDDGPDGQCGGVDGGPAWVTIAIDRGGVRPTGSPAPFDLLATDFDPIGFPSNPHWGFEQQNPGGHPDPSALCAGFPYVDPSDPSRGVGLGNPACTTQSPSVNAPAWGFNDWLCSSAATDGHLHGHLNWWAVAVNGSIQWDDHTDWTQKGDDDYNFKLKPNAATALTTSNPETIGLEFDSDETVDTIDQGWWNEFHQAVDSNGGKSGGPAGSMIDGHQAVVVGLLGLDSEHGAYSELHPVYGLAIQLDGSPNDDTWSLLARNWGDEGFCSQGTLELPITAISFFLPKPGATGGSADLSQLFSNKDNKTVSVLTRQGGAVVTVELGEPSERTLVQGKIHIAWTFAGSAPIPATFVAPAVVAAERERAARGAVFHGAATGIALANPEKRLSSLVEALPENKKAVYLNEVRGHAPAVSRAHSVSLGAAPAIHVAVPLRARLVPNPEKAARDKQRAAALCRAYGGRIPNAPATLCVSAPVGPPR
jgi:hypothetical protein